MPDRVRFLESLDTIAKQLRRLGLSRVTRMGRELLRWVFRNEITIEWEEFRITGGIEQRGYLASLRRGERESGTLTVFRSLVPLGGVVVDVGAYLGVYTLLSARLVGEQGHVIAIEADPRSLLMLKRNVIQNGLIDRVRVLEAAASDESGSAEFFLNDGDASASSLYVCRLGGRCIRVPTIRLDDALADLPYIDVMKIDVEGAEPRVIRGAERILKRSPNVSIICEVNPATLEAAGSSAEELIDLLQDFGFEVYQIDEKGERLSPLPLSWKSVKYVNVLAPRIGTIQAGF